MKPIIDGWRRSFPGREISVVSSTLDDRQWLISAHGDTEPGETYLFDRDSHTLAFQYKVREKLPRESLAPMQAVRYKSSDGLEIPGLSDACRRACEAKNLPTLMVPHGGPWARDEWGYNAAGAVLRQSRLCRADAQFPRLHGLRQEIPERGQWRVGHEDAGRSHLGREISDGGRNRRSEAHRNFGRLLRRIRNAGRCRLHAGSVSRGSGYRRPVESAHSARGDSALLGSRPQNHVRAHGRSGYARRQEVAGGSVAAPFAPTKSRRR